MKSFKIVLAATALALSSAPAAAKPPATGCPKDLAGMLFFLIPSFAFDHFFGGRCS